jgi:TPR repeat protein
MKKSVINSYETAKKYYQNKNYKKAYEIFLDLAEAGNTDAQVSLGNMFYHGDGVEQDIESAYKWLERAAYQNDKEALYYCGIHYLEDTQEKKKGKEYLLKAMQLNYISAILAMAYYYEYGDQGFTQNVDKAIQLYKKACQMEDSNACLHFYILMKKCNKINELQNFIKDEIGRFKFLKLLLKDNWKKFLTGFGYKK